MDDSRRMPLLSMAVPSVAFLPVLVRVVHIANLTFVATVLATSCLALQAFSKLDEEEYR